MNADTAGGGPNPATAGRAARLTRLPSRLVTPFVVILSANVLLLLASMTFLNINLLSQGTLRTFSPILGVMIIATLAQAFVISNGGVDLSIPGVITLAGAVTLKSPRGMDDGIPKALFICLVVALIVGVVNSVFVELLRLNSLVVTLATGSLVLGVTRLYRGQINSATQVPPLLSKWATNHFGSASYVLLVAVVLCVLLVVVLRVTTPGRKLLASSSSREAATLVGLPITPLRMAPWIASAVLASGAGVLLAGQVGTPDLTIGDPYLLATVAASVLGGAVVTGGPLRPISAALGALFITLLSFDLQAHGYSSGVSQVAQGLVLGLGLALVSWLRGPNILRALYSRVNSSSSRRTRSLVMGE